MSDIIKISDRDGDSLEFSTETEVYSMGSRGHEKRTTLTVALSNSEYNQVYVTAYELRNLSAALTRWANKMEEKPDEA